MAKVLISYRREDTGLMVGRICDRLRSHYGPDQVMMDIDSIPYGLDFRKHIREALEQCDTMLAIIGPSWAAANEDGKPRLEDETDWVRIEVEGALVRDIPVIPVLVNGARMPKPQQLPGPLQDFAFRQATEIDMGRDFHAHMDRLIRVMDQLLTKIGVEGSAAESEQVKPVSVQEEKIEPKMHKKSETEATRAASAAEMKGGETSHAPSDAKGKSPEQALDRVKADRLAQGIAILFLVFAVPFQFIFIIFWAMGLD
jgi:hypothetical protein